MRHRQRLRGHRLIRIEHAKIDEQVGALIYPREYERAQREGNYT